VFGQNNDIFNMLEGLTHNFPATEDGARRILVSNGFIPAGKDRYINSFEGVSIVSRSEYGTYSANRTEITFIFKFNDDLYFVKFIREYLTYFSNRYGVSFNGSHGNSNYYVFYNENEATALAMDYNSNEKNVVIWVSLNN
jgi:hypothetical protein